MSSATKKMHFPSRKIVVWSSVLVVLIAALSRYMGWQGLLGRGKGEGFVCEEGSYTTEIISIDPLVIYINNFTSEREIEELITVGYVFPSLNAFSSSLLSSVPSSRRY